MKGTYHRKTIEIPKVHQTVTFALNVEVQSILQKNALNILNRIHLTLVARIVVYFIKTDSAKTKGKDLILENKDTLNPEALPDPDTLGCHTLDSNPMREMIRIEHTKIHIKIKAKTDLAATPTPRALVEVDPTHRKEKDPTHSTEISHLQDIIIIPRQTKPVDTEKCT